VTNKTEIENRGAGYAMRATAVLSVALAVVLIYFLANFLLGEPIGTQQKTNPQKMDEAAPAKQESTPNH
jgi:hypothetical protein